MIRSLNWEFWPWQVIYFPVMLYWVWLSVKSRSLFFFTAVNPGIESGGLLVESKSAILNRIPGALKPATFFFQYPVSFEEVMDKISEMTMHFPIIAKPDYGERGRRVEKLEDPQELKLYINCIRESFIIQEYIDLPFETGIFYYRYPDHAKGTISSMVIKEMLHVTGDGSSTVEALMNKEARTRLQIDKVKLKHPDLMNRVPDKGEKLELVSVGNHNRGTTFLNANHLIDDTLIEIIDQIARDIDGFYYGRFDIRCGGIEAFKMGESIKILELNGAKSEPAHIYHPGFSLLEAYKVLFFHWNTLYKIASINHRKGIKYPSWQEGWALWRKYRYYRRLYK